MNNTEQNKTHYRKAFKSPYLSSADIVEPTVLTISHVRLESDKTKKSKDFFNTAYFVEKEIRSGEKLKPMILNAHNSKIVKSFSDSAFIEDWNNIKISVYVDSNVRFGRDTVEGLRIDPNQPVSKRKVLTPSQEKMWNNAVLSAKKYGNLDAVLKHVDISDEHQEKIMELAKNEVS